MPPIGSVVRHKCDTTFCVNPDHLEIGTQLDNIRDRQSRNRQARGEELWGAKLTAKDVATIRTRAMSQQQYAVMFGVSSSHVCRIQTGKKWAHI